MKCIQPIIKFRRVKHHSHVRGNHIQMRGEIERRFAMDAVDIYGLSEVIGPGVANECVESKDGPVVWEDHFYPEIIDPNTGRVLPDGEQGELVFTSLTKEALPVIRYRTRDLTRLLPPTSRAMRRIGKQHAIEVVGEELRGMMPWISAGKKKVSEVSGG
mgnify:CR=1 FL=1